MMGLRDEDCVSQRGHFRSKEKQLIQDPEVGRGGEVKKERGEGRAALGKQPRSPLSTLTLIGKTSCCDPGKLRTLLGGFGTPPFLICNMGRRKSALRK